jgi:hypothetical protein
VVSEKRYLRNRVEALEGVVAELCWACQVAEDLLTQQHTQECGSVIDEWQAYGALRLTRKHANYMVKAYKKMGARRKEKQSEAPQ